MNHPLHFFLAVASALMIAGCSESNDAEPSVPKPEVFDDALISFPVPEGGTVQPTKDNTYLVFFGEELFYLMIRGASEPEDYGKQRTEAARAEVLAKKRTVGDDGEILTVTDVSETIKHEINGEGVYLFEHSVSVESNEPDGSGAGTNTIGFGSVAGKSIWFQHTSGTAGDHPAAILSFLESVTFK